MTITFGDFAGIMVRRSVVALQAPDKQKSCRYSRAHAKGVVRSERRVSAFYDVLKPPF